MVPEVAVQLVAPGDENWRVLPTTTVARLGVMVWVVGATSMMDAVADPLGPVAVTVAEPPAGIVDGAV